MLRSTLVNTLCPLPSSAVLSSLCLAIIQLNSSQASAALAVRGRLLYARREGDMQKQLIERAMWVAAGTSDWRPSFYAEFWHLIRLNRQTKWHTSMKIRRWINEFKHIWHYVVFRWEIWLRWEAEAQALPVLLRPLLSQTFCFKGYPAAWFFTFSF